jgi:hypothetical protein
VSIRCIVDVRRLPSVVTSVLVASEDFTGATGAAWPSQWVALIDDGVATQQSGKGRLVANGSGFRGIRRALSAINLKNVEVYAELTPRTLDVGYVDIEIRQDLSRKGLFGDGYFTSFDTGGSVWTLGKIDSDNGQSSNTDKTVTWTTTPWAVRMRAVENVITSKVWKVSDGEASAQTQTLVDSTYNRSGSVALGYNSGEGSTNPGIDWDSVKVWDLGNTTVTPTDPGSTTMTWDFTGSNGAAMPSAFSVAKGLYYEDPSITYPKTAAPTIQSNKLVLASGSTAAWSGGASVFLGDPSKPEGNSTTGAPPIASNGTWTFDMSFTNLTQQYPTFFFRARGADLWPGGDDANTPRNGGYCFLFQPLEGQILLQQNYNGAVLATIPFTYTSKDMKVKMTLSRKRASFKFWPAASSEPSSWTYDADNIVTDESDGSIGWSIFNGPANEQKTITIDNLVYSTPVLTLGTDRTTPAAEPSGFTRILYDNFDTAASAGASTGQFMNVYQNSFQPYDDGGQVYVPANGSTPASGGGAMYPRQMISAHDGVMDISSDGQRASAGSFGSSTTAYNRIGGRFSIRMKAIGLFNNGPAFMLWPSDTGTGTWYFGEIDFPESVSGRGGVIGFQDAPYIHHHKMVQGQENLAQDVPLGVSWRDWHVYTVEWYPPNSTKGGSTGLVIYYVDGVEVYRTTTDVPSTVHRWCFQIGDWGAPGNIYIDWITMASLN